MTRDENILHLYKAGFTLSYVAKQLGLTIGTVAGVARRAGVKRVSWGINPDRASMVTDAVHRAVVADRFSGMKYRDIAAKHGLSERTCSRLVTERPMVREVAA